MEQFSVLDPHEKSGMVQKKYNAGDKKCFPFAFWKVLNGFIRIQASLVSSHLTTTCVICFEIVSLTFYSIIPSEFEV